MQKGKKTNILSVCCAVALVILTVLNAYLGVTAGKKAAQQQNEELEQLYAVELSDLSTITDGLPASYRSQIEQYAAQPPAEGFTPEELAAITRFYSESAFVGDSLLIGFRSYLQKHDRDACFVKSTMLASYSYSTKSALKNVSEDSIHPIYKGMQRQVWDSLKMSGAKRVFLMFWANEIPRGKIDLSRSYLEKLVKRIRQECPGIEIYIVSPCHRFNDPDDKPKYLTNKNFSLLAASQKEFCELNGAGYVEVSKYIGNETEGIFPEYTFDKYVHINDDAYDIWKQVFSEYALGQVAVIDNGH